MAGTDLAIVEQSPGGGDLAEIKQLAGDRKSAYWRGGDAARLQKRHLELIEAAAPAEEQPLRPVIPAGATRLEVAAGRSAQGVMANLAPSAVASLDASFGALPAGVIAATREELAAPCPRVVQPADDDLVARFSRSARGRDLAVEWKSMTATRLGRIQARLDRWLDRMTDADREVAQAWFRGLPAAQAAAIFRALSA